MAKVYPSHNKKFIGGGINLLIDLSFSQFWGLVSGVVSRHIKSIIADRIGSSCTVN
jgi:hypothetical protein